MKKARLLATALLTAFMGIALLMPMTVEAASAHTASPQAASAATATSPFTNIPVTGNGTNTAGTVVGTFAGTLNVTRFVVQNGALYAVGTLSGTLTNLLTNVSTSVTNVPVALPVTGMSGSCQILHLVLGPLNLNLLGLTVSLNQVVLDITAQSGPGNLLGNLLCAVANLLNTNGPLTGIAGLLNNILRAL